MSSRLLSLNAGTLLVPHSQPLPFNPEVELGTLNAKQQHDVPIKRPYGKGTYFEWMRIMLLPSLFYQYRKPLSDPLLPPGVQI
jgi:hypothetical protein